MNTLSEYGLRNAHVNKIELFLLSELTIILGFWNTTFEKPAWARMDTNPYYSDSVSWKSTSGRVYANRKPINVFGDWWQHSLAVSLPTNSSAFSYNETVLRPHPVTLRRPDSVRWPYQGSTIGDGIHYHLALYTRIGPQCLDPKTSHP